jgi:hypothetical protein
MTVIYKGTLPRDFIETVGCEDDAMLDFLIGHWEVIDARAKGMEFQLLLGQEDFTSQQVECQVKLIGDDKRMTWWLLNYRAKWPTGADFYSKKSAP